MATFKFVVKRSKGKPIILEDGTITVYLKYTHLEKSSLFSTGVRVPYSDWNGEKDQRYPIKGTGKDKKNKLANAFKSSLEDIVADIIKEGREPTIKLVKAIYKYKKEEEKDKSINQPQDALTLFNKFIAYSHQHKTNSTVRAIKITWNKLKRYQEDKKIKRIELAEIDISFYHKFVSYLSNQCGLQDASVGKEIKTLKSFLNWCANKGLEIHNDVKKFKVYRDADPIKIFLTQDELATLFQFDFSKKPSLEWARDLFVFQCHTGLRVSDLNRLKKHHIIDGAIQMQAYKTGKRMYVPLTPVPRAILEKYDYELPRKSEGKYNLYLKEAIRAVGISSEVETFKRVKGQKVISRFPKHKVISSHDAIKTFITHCSQKGISAKTVAEITGKSVNVILKHYYGTDQNTIKSEMIRAFGP